MRHYLTTYFKSILLGLLATTLAVPAGAQTFFKVNQYNVILDGSWMPIFTLYSSYAFNEKLGFSSYFYVNGSENGSWGEGLAGPTWTPAKGVTLAFLAGIQSNEESMLRVSPVFIVSKEKFSAFSSIEYGGKRHRWDLMAFYVARPFKVGGELIRYFKMFAAGPRVEYSFLKKQPLTVFYSGLWDWEGERYASMFGMYTTFGR
jgi:hypothetical protein